MLNTMELGVGMVGYDFGLTVWDTRYPFSTLLLHEYIAATALYILYTLPYQMTMPGLSSPSVSS